jgi:hypothetical protein
LNAYIGARYDPNMRRLLVGLVLAWFGCGSGDGGVDVDNPLTDPEDGPPAGNPNPEATADQVWTTPNCDNQDHPRLPLIVIDPWSAGCSAC